MRLLTVVPVATGTGDRGPRFNPEQYRAFLHNQCLFFFFAVLDAALDAAAIGASASATRAERRDGGGLVLAAPRLGDEDGGDGWEGRGRADDAAAGAADAATACAPVSADVAVASTR